MSDMIRDNPDNVTQPESRRDFKARQNPFNIGRFDELVSKVSFMQGLESIVKAFFDKPDFHKYYEHDLDRRVWHAWARVGRSMWLALGEPMKFSVIAPDGRETTHTVVPDVSKVYLREIAQAKEEIKALGARGSIDREIVNMIPGRKVRGSGRE